MSPGRKPALRTEEDDYRAEIRARQCVVAGEGIRGAELREEASFSIHSRDEKGIPITTGGDRFKVSFRGRSALELQLYDMGDGSYEGRYIATVGGTYELIMLLDGKVRPPP